LTAHQANECATSFPNTTSASLQQLTQPIVSSIARQVTSAAADSSLDSLIESVQNIMEPKSKETETTAVIDISVQCTQKTKEGERCSWRGSIAELPVHQRNECQFQILECKCGRKLLRGEMVDHLTSGDCAVRRQQRLLQTALVAKLTDTTTPDTRSSIKRPDLSSQETTDLMSDVQSIVDSMKPGSLSSVQNVAVNEILAIRCPNYSAKVVAQLSCNWEGPSNKLGAHIADCQFQKTYCKCGKQFIRKDLTRHVTLKECTALRADRISAQAAAITRLTAPSSIVRASGEHKSEWSTEKAERMVSWCAVIK
jgi:hypothetical protein